MTYGNFILTYSLSAATYSEVVASHSLALRKAMDKLATMPAHTTVSIFKRSNSEILFAASNLRG